MELITLRSFGGGDKVKKITVLEAIIKKTANRALTGDHKAALTIIGLAHKEGLLTPEQAFQKRQQERAEAEQKAAQERAEAQEKRTNCDSAQASLRQLQSGQRLSTVNAAGERVYLDDEQRSGQIARQQKAVADWCK